jgi:hypothetical protein
MRAGDKLLCRKGGIAGPNADQDRPAPCADLIGIKERRLNPYQD